MIVHANKNGYSLRSFLVLCSTILKRILEDLPRTHASQNLSGLNLLLPKSP